MPKIDLRKQLKHLYNPPKNKFTAVDVPAMNFLMIDGKGDPNTSKAFQVAMEALYSLAYTLKFALKLGKYGDKKYDYPVMPLEGLWWMDDMGGFTVGKKDKWKWTLMIVLPDFITRSMFNAARKEVAEKKNPLALPKVRLGKFKEGPSAQIMYIGKFADEGPTIQRLHEFIKESGHKLRGKHHEIYMSDPRRTAPEKLKTVIRQPFR
jgi:hypothetical protein